MGTLLELGASISGHGVSALQALLEAENFTESPRAHCTLIAASWGRLPAANAGWHELSAVMLC